MGPGAVLAGCGPDLSAHSEAVRVYLLRYPDPLLFLALERSLCLKEEGLDFDCCSVVRTSVTFYFFFFFQALNFLVESFGLLNDLFPLLSILDTGYPIFDLHLADVLFDVILPSVLGPSL